MLPNSRILPSSSPPQISWSARPTTVTPMTPISPPRDLTPSHSSPTISKIPQHTRQEVNPLYHHHHNGMWSPAPPNLGATDLQKSIGGAKKSTVRKGWEWIRRKPNEPPQSISSPALVSAQSISRSDTTHGNVRSQMVSRPSPMTSSNSDYRLDRERRLQNSIGVHPANMGTHATAINSRPGIPKSQSDHQIRPPVRSSSLRRKKSSSEKSVDYDKRKSDGTMSIYNTFGSEDIQAIVDVVPPVNVPATNSGINRPATEHKSGGVRETHVLSKAALEDLQSPQTKNTDAASWIADQFQHINPALLSQSQLQSDSPQIPNSNSADARRSTQSTNTVTTAEYESAEDISSDSDLDSDDFVDALSPEEAERAKAEAKLSKRLSGHDFGSAGGLVLNILDEPAKRTSFDHNNPTPESLVKAMLEWKRSSVDGKRISPQSLQGLRSSLIRDMHCDGHNDKATTKEKKMPSRLQTVPDIQLSPSSAPSTPIDMKLFVDNFSNSFDSLMSESESFHLSDLKDPRQLSTPQLSITPVAQDSNADDNDDTDDDEAVRAASALWDEDESFVEKESMTEWLGQSKSLNARALHLYMQKFDFSRMRLDSAFRKLCSKLFLRAEAQVIDRVLEVFATRYWSCNSESLFGSSDVVYAVVYSLLLLNTDLHVAQGSHTRMTRSAFVRNTMMTVRDTRPPVKQDGRAIQQTKVWEDHMEAMLRDMYTSVKANQILQPIQPGARKNGYLKRRMGSIRKSMRNSMLFNSNPELNNQAGEELQTETTAHVTNATTAAPVISVAPPAPSPATELDEPVNETSNISMSASSTTATLPSVARTSDDDSIEEKSTSSQADTRYCKNGFVIRKHLLESAETKARHRNWSEFYLNIEKGHLCAYYVTGVSLSDNVNRRSVFRLSGINGVPNGNHSSLALSSESAPTSNVGNSWRATSQMAEKISLLHALANALPAPGYNRQRPYVFALQLPNGGVNLFQVNSSEEATAWVDCCNYWAARQSNVSLAQGVINMEYGWSERVLEEDFSSDSINLYDWSPPTPSMTASQSDEFSQLNQLRKHLDELNDEMDEHCTLDKKIESKFASRKNLQAKALNNWHHKFNYLRREIIKYDSYCNILTDSMVKQDKRRREIFSATMKSTPPLKIEESKFDLVKELQDELLLVSENKWF